MSWFNFGGLAIKDFHLDLGSLMDSLAPVVLQAYGVFDAEGTTKFPVFPDIQKKNGSARAPKFRGGLPASILSIIDSTDGWWPDVKRIRDTLAHRENLKLVFGVPAQGVLFQIYTPGQAPEQTPNILHPAFLSPHGVGVADFRLYSACIMAEVFSFLDDLGAALALHLSLPVQSMTPSMRVGDFSDLMEAMSELAAKEKAAPE